MRIIYVDDEKPAIHNFRLTVERIAEIEELHTFQSGEEAVRFVRTNAVDTAFLDMGMPGIHGLELAKALWDCNGEMQVVFVTEFEQDVPEEPLGIGTTGYLLKPYTADDIRTVLERRKTVAVQGVGTKTGWKSERKSDLHFR